MKSLKNNILIRKHKKPILLDYFYEATNTPKSLVIFCHGYKGFKDWGAWDLVAKAFAKANFFFVKFNFSHNGGTMEQPIDFPDLEAFGQNNYTKELDDLEDILSYCTNTAHALSSEIDRNHIILIGHSRAGGITTIKASENRNITKLVTWASICDFGKRTATIGNLEQWKKEGVKYVINGRTKQQMPHFYQFYEDFKANEARLHIKSAAQQLQIPHLILHGDADTAITITEAEALHSWNAKSKLSVIEDANHVFGASHPWNKETLPEHLKEVVMQSIAFIK